MKIKETPEDFIVEELLDVTLEGGEYSYVALTKRNVAHFHLISLLSSALGIPEKHIGIAGIKDTVAVTTQVVSLKGVSKMDVQHCDIDGIKMKYLGKGKYSLGPGMLKGNYFTIIVRDADTPHVLERYKNYYGEQRFGRANVEIGRALVRREYEKAVVLLAEYNVKGSKKMLTWIKEKPTDIVGALKCIHPRLLKLIVQSYQSWLWNEVAREYAGDVLPVLGYGTEDSSMYADLMEKEHIKQRDFLNRSIEVLSLDGTERDVWVEPFEFSCEQISERVYKVAFFLPRGCYATEIIRQLFVQEASV